VLDSPRSHFVPSRSPGRGFVHRRALGRDVSSRALVRVAFALALIAFAEGARAEGVYWSTKDLLRAFFSSSERVTYVEVPRADVERALGEKVAKDRYVVYVARSGERVDGFAVVDEEKGEHQPITFGVKISPDGRVERTEVMAYREAYGEEIRELRFRKQFLGRSMPETKRFGDDVVAISGATISSRSMLVAVRRALALVAAARALPPDGRRAALPPPASTGG